VPKRYFADRRRQTGNPRWYEEYVPVADQLFDDHLKQIKREEKEHGKEFP
jgi:hypothetical protein